MRFLPIRQLSTSIKRLDLNKATEKSLRARENDIVELNREQLNRGETATTGNFLPDYSEVSVKKYGKKAGRMNLFDTGDFHKAIKPEFAQTSFLLDDKDWKTDMLEERYGDDIIGLSPASINELAQDALGSIQYELRQQL